MKSRVQSSSEKESEDALEWFTLREEEVASVLDRGQNNGPRHSKQTMLKVKLMWVMLTTHDLQLERVREAIETLLSAPKVHPISSESWSSVKGQVTLVTMWSPWRQLSSGTLRYKWVGDDPIQTLHSYSFWRRGIGGIITYCVNNGEFSSRGSIISQTLSPLIHSHLSYLFLMSVCGGKDGKCSCIFTAGKGLPDRKKWVEELLPVSGRGDREDESMVRHKSKTHRQIQRVLGERHFSTQVNISLFHAIAERTQGAV